MIHRALFGSYERFIGILIEHLARRASRCGSRRCRRSCCRSPTATTATRGEVVRRAARGGLRVELDERTESVGRKIRDAELRKIPFMLVVGDREAESGTVAVREHGGGRGGSGAGGGARRAGRRADRRARELTAPTPVALRIRRYTRPTLIMRSPTSPRSPA